MSNKSKLQRFLSGVIKGLKLSLLPKSVEAIHLNPIVRILRVLGGVSILVVITGLVEKGSFLFYSLGILGILQIVYIIIINLIKFFYFIYLWKNKKLEVRNSPLDRLATFGLKLAACAKGFCTYSISMGATLTLGITIDELLIAQGREGVFRKTVGGVLDELLTKYGIDNPNKDLIVYKKEVDEIKFQLDKLRELGHDINEINKLASEVNALDSEVFQEVNEDIKKQIVLAKNKALKAQSKILCQISDSNNNSDIISKLNYSNKGENPFNKDDK